MDDQAFGSLGGWPGTLTALLEGRSFTAEQSEAILDEVLTGRATPAQIAGLAVALRGKGPSVDEMTGFVRAMLTHAVPLELPAGMEVIDTCGTGGDRLRSVNVSTMVSLIVAAAGVKVCKHGGRASSSSVGAADVLEALGAVADLAPEGVVRCIEEVGLGFCFAPRFHPAMRHAAPIRRELGIPTVFNYLGPLANPGRARFQIVGVNDVTMAETMLGVLAANGARRAMVVHGDDGLDELSTTGPSTIHELAADGTVTSWRIHPADVGLPVASLDDLRGGDGAVNAEAIRRVVAGDRSAHRDIAVLNAAAALMIIGRVEDMGAGVALAQMLLDDGSAAGVLDAFVRTTVAAAAAAAAAAAG